MYLRLVAVVEEVTGQIFTRLTFWCNCSGPKFTILGLHVKVFFFSNFGKWVWKRVVKLDEDIVLWLTEIFASLVQRVTFERNKLRSWGHDVVYKLRSIKPAVCTLIFQKNVHCWPKWDGRNPSLTFLAQFRLFLWLLVIISDVFKNSHRAFD